METSNAQRSTSNAAGVKRGDMFLFFDTETTGKADFKAPQDAAHQPRLVQLAALFTNADGDEIACMNVVVRPDRFVIPDEATAVHGISTEQALAQGVPLAHALALFSSLARLADVYVAHNIAFDQFLMDGECARMVVDFPRRTGICTMKTMTDVCQIPGLYGFKWPKLQEAFKHCFGREFDGAHDALADVRACKEIFFWQRAQSK